MVARLYNVKGTKAASITAHVSSSASSDDAIVLVGTYKKGQLDWIRENGVYNYPVEECAHTSMCDSENKPDLSVFGAKVKELWLYADVKSRRHRFTAEFVGIQSNEEFLAANPAYGKLGPARHARYMVFKVAPFDYGPKLDGPDVFARIGDFKNGRAQAVAKAINRYKSHGEIASLAAYLPSDLADLPPEQLYVCETAVQLDFLDALYFDVERIKFRSACERMRMARQEHKPICVEICAGAGGQAIGLEMAGFAHVALVEYENDYCEVLRSNNPKWNVICADVHKFDGHPYEGVDLLAGGVPCPPFSVASKQLGEADERDLFPEAIRLIGEIKPKAVMIENVRGLLDPKFDEYRNSILKKIDALGYDVNIKLLHASDFGVPQIRPRVVIVGILKSLRKKFEYPEALNTRAPTVGEAIGDLMAANGWRGVDEWKRNANSIAPTIVGGSKKHGGPDLGPTRARRAWAALSVDGLGIANEAPSRDFVGNPKLTKEMLAVIQGFPREWNFGSKKTAACRMIGNAFPPPVAMAVGQQIIRCLEDE